MSNTAAESLLTPISRAAGRRCASQHFGPWSVEPKWFKAAVDAIRSGTLKPRADWGDDMDDEDEDDGTGYTVKNGVAIICIDGQMTKKGSSFGGCSTVAVRQSLRNAAADWQVRAVALHICSPGGTVAGTADLADDVNGVRQGKFGGKPKPVIAYIADMGCSAAYWVASQCETIYANTTAIVGSIGTYTVLEDDTGAQEQIGVKYRVVSTGAYKGLGADGKLSDELVADVQREVNELNQPFLAAVQAGRGKKISDLAAVADGRAYAGAQAKQLGLVDAIESFDAAIEAVSNRSNSMTPTEQVKQIAAEHPEAVASFIEQGKKAGVAEGTTAERQRVLGIAEAHGIKDHAAVASITAGHDVETATVIATTASKAKAEAEAKATAQAEAHKAEVARLQQEIEKAKFEASGAKPIATAPAVAAATTTASAVADAPTSNDPKARKDWAEAKAGEQWDKEPESRKGYSTRERFVAVRSREILGLHKTLSK